MAASVFGFLGIGANIVIYQQNNGKKLIIFKLISDIIWAVHFLLLNANSAAGAAVLGIFREIVFFNQDKKWAKSKSWLIFFLGCSIAVAILTWKNIFSLYPAVASALSVISFWKKNPKLSRGLVFPISACMLIYDITCGSYFGIVNELLTLTSASIGIIRHLK